jgi:hypothetical protein
MKKAFNGPEQYGTDGELAGHDLLRPGGIILYLLAIIGNNER